jgi:hypothetical protein
MSKSCLAWRVRQSGDERESEQQEANRQADYATHTQEVRKERHEQQTYT